MINAELKRLITAELSDEYLAKFLNIPIERVLNAKQGVYEEEPVKPVRAKKPKLVPVSRPFPILTADMSDSERIIVLAKHGLSARKIQRYLVYPHSVEQIDKFARKKLGPVPKKNTSIEHSIAPAFMPYVKEALRRLGKDPYKCELCLDPVPKGCVVHHTKYEGSTVYDLMYICVSCNLSRANKGLD